MFIYEVLSSRGHGTRVIVGESYLLFTCFTCWAMRNHFSTGWAMRNHFLPVGQWETIFYRLINEKPLFTDWSMRNHFFYRLNNEKPFFLPVEQWETTFLQIEQWETTFPPVEQWEATFFTCWAMRNHCLWDIAQTCSSVCYTGILWMSISSYPAAASLPARSSL